MTSVVETAIGALPANWKAVALGDLISEGPMNGLYKHGSAYGEGTLILRINDFTNDGDVVSGASHRVAADKGELEQYALSKDDIVVNRVNSLSHLGKTALIGALSEPMIFESNMMRFRVDERSVLPSFVFRVLNSPLCKRQILGNAKRAVAQASINQGNVKSVVIPLPPIDDQRKISALLGLLRRTIEQQDRLVALTTELKRTLRHQLFTQGLSGEPQKHTQIGPVPQSWDLVQLGHICTLGTGTTPPTARQDYYEGDVPFVKTTEIENNRIATTQTHVSSQAVVDCRLKLYPPGTVLMAMYGQGKTRGQVALLELAATTTQNAAAIQPSECVNAEFLWQYLMSRYQELRSAGALGHISHLNLGYLRDRHIPVPSLDVQREIAALLTSVDRKRTVHESKSGLIQELFRNLSHHLMTGQMRVHNLEMLDLDGLTE